MAQTTDKWFFFLPPLSFSSQTAPETAGYVWEAFSNPCNSFIVSIQLNLEKKNILTTSLDGTCHVITQSWIMELKQWAYHPHSCLRLLYDCRSRWAYKITKGLNLTHCSQGAVGYRLYGKLCYIMQFTPRYFTSAGVDVLRSCSLTNQVILIKPRAFLCHHHWLGCFLSPCVNHLGNRIRIYESKTKRCTTFIFCTC